MSQDIMQVIPTLWPVGLMILIFYFLLYRPQKQQQKRRQELLNNLKKGDKVVTIGGIHGTITALNETTITLKITEKIEITLERASVGHRLGQEES